MKGISPVIATVILLLIAVSAVGGVWIWYSRQSSSIQSSSEEKIAEQLEQQSSVSVTVGNLLNSSGNLTIDSVVVDGPKKKELVSVSCSLSPKSTSSCDLKKKVYDYCTSKTEDIKLQFYVSGNPTQEFLEKCPA